MTNPIIMLALMGAYTAVVILTVLVIRSCNRMIAICNEMQDTINQMRGHDG